MEEVEQTDNSVVEPILAAWLYRRRRKEKDKKKRKRQVWINPINEMREKSGVFDSLFKYLRSNESKFFSYFRMSITSFDELLERLKDSIQKRNTCFRNCVRTVERLAITLRYLAIGATYTELHKTFRVGVSTAGKIIRDVCQALWKVLAFECLPPLTKETFESVAAGFQHTANFPHCLGALGGKRIKVMCPAESGADLIVLLAVADSEYRFIYAHTGGYERCHADSSIFKETDLWKSIDDGSMDTILPDEEYLPGIDDMEVPYFFAADATFGLHKHLMRPFAGTQLSFERRVFNSRLRRAQRFNECAFGILSNKWGILHKPFNVQPDVANDIVKACIVLHNYVRERDGYKVEDTLSIMGLEDIDGEDASRGQLKHANSIRNTLCKYFVSSEGQLSWQMAKIQ